MPSISPVLSDLFLAMHDRKINKLLEGTSVIQVFRFVDDFLIIIDNANADFHQTVGNVLDIFERHLSPLILTHELPEVSIRSRIHWTDWQVHKHQTKRAQQEQE